MNDIYNNEKIKIYIEELLNWNKSYNLISKFTINDIWKIHIYDSLEIYKYLIKNNINTVVDIGSGAGFPSIPLSILINEKKFILTEVNSKKLAFLNYIVKLLSLNCEVIDINNNFFYDGICIGTSRAFSTISNIIKWVNKHIPFCKNIYILKGKINKIYYEINESKITNYEIINLNKGNLVIINR